MTRQQPTWTRLYDDSWGVRLDHSCAHPGDVVTVARRDGTSSDVKLEACLNEGPSWSLWRVTTVIEIPKPKRVQARRPIIRRAGGLVKLPVVRPEPPPLTDADAPPTEDEPDDK